MYYIYQTAPVDYFQGLVRITDVAREYVLTPEDHREGDRELFNLFSLAMSCAHAVSRAKGSYWEGNISVFYVFALPDPDASPPHYGLMWKQSNNGTTYICSPVPLPWIEPEALLTTMEH
jgi:hypothetical protein